MARRSTDRVDPENFKKGQRVWKCAAHDGTCRVSEVEIVDTTARSVTYFDLEGLKSERRMLTDINTREFLFHNREAAWEWVRERLKDRVEAAEEVLKRRRENLERWMLFEGTGKTARVEE